MERSGNGPDMYRDCHNQPSRPSRFCLTDRCARAHLFGGETFDCALRSGLFHFSSISCASSLPLSLSLSLSRVLVVHSFILCWIYISTQFFLCPYGRTSPLPLLCWYIPMHFHKWTCSSRSKNLAVDKCWNAVEFERAERGRAEKRWTMVESIGLRRPKETKGDQRRPKETRLSKVFFSKIQLE